ncbi:MAG: ATP-binding protein [Mariprofundales bacterium]|nr:ATP-binding protein [Mariprofundales bacterium]
MAFYHRPFTLDFQLKILFVLVVGLAALMMGAAWTATQSEQLTAQLKETVVSQARVAALALQPALAFGDQRLIGRYLASFVGDEELAEITVYGVNGMQIADYHRPGSAVQLPRTDPHWHGFHLADGGLEYATSIILNGTHLGTLVLRHTLKHIALARHHGIMITLAAGLIAILLGLLLAHYMLRVITDPIRRLGVAMSQLSGVSVPELRPHAADSRDMIRLFEGFHTMTARLLAAKQVTERQRLQLEEREQMLQSIVSSLPVPLVISRVEDGAFLEFNQAFRDLLLPDDGQCNDYFAPDFYCKPEQRAQLVALVKREGVALGFPCTLRNGQGEMVEVLISSVEILFRGEVALLNTMLDVTELIALRRALERANQDLEQRIAKRTTALHRAREQADQANHEKSQFLAAASHDLRQPLHAIMLFLDVLAGLPDQEDPQEIIGQLQLSANALASLLDGLLDLSRYEGGNIALDMQSMPLAPLLQRLAQEWSPQLAQKGLELRLAGGVTMYMVRSDPALLYRILNNLMANALRYTEHGGVILGCRRHGDGVRVGVWDTGCGIGEDQQRHIFETFYQVGNSERDRTKGVGLGLSIVKSQAELLGHPIYLRSRLGRGSCFAVDLPYSSSDAQSDSPRPWRSEPSSAESICRLPTAQRVLVVDDEKTILQGTKLMLRGWGLDPLLAESGGQAMALLDAGGDAPQLIIADYRLRDGENGIDLVAELRQRLGHDLPAIIITGEREGALRQLCQSNRCTLVRKPIDGGRFKQVVAMLLHQPLEKGNC